MNNKKEYIVKEKTLTNLVKWLNSVENLNFKKVNNIDFTVGDVQSYTKRGVMPIHMGGNVIEKDEKIQEVKLYNIVK